MARATIGFLSVEVRGWYEQRFMAGVATRPRRKTSMWSFSSRQARGLRSRAGGIYTLAGPDRLEGLIVSGTLGHGTDADTVRHFCDRYRALPLVSWAVDLPVSPWYWPTTWAGCGGR